MTDKLGPIEIEFLLDKKANEEAKRLKASLDDIGPSGKKSAESLKTAVQEQKNVIAGIEKDIKKLESMLKTIAPGMAKVELSGELKAAKKALEEEKAILAGVEQQAKATEAAHVTLRTQLRQMKEELVGLEAAGKRGTAEYDALQTRFADLTNAMGDAQKQANILANDERGMQGVIQGLTGLTGAASAAQGVFGLFAGENENLHKIMLKVQSLMAITIGLQQVQQTLNKDSAFSIVVLTKAKTGLAVAETRLAAAFGISTVAARALMATLTLGLSVAIGVAIAAITRLVNKSQEAKKATSEFNEATAEAAYASIASFERMRQEWNRLGNDMKAKNKYIKENEDAFKDLGIQITGVADAESVFVANKDKFLQALLERAQAVAGYELATDTFKQYLEKRLETETLPAKERKWVPSGTPGESGSYVEEYSNKWLKAQGEMDDLYKKAQGFITNSIEAGERSRKIIEDLGLSTTKNLEKIALLEEKISEQEKLLLESVEAGKESEAKVIADRIFQLKEELRLRNLLLDAIYAQKRANELITNTQAGAWQPAAAPAGSIGAPSTGGKAAGARYWQTPVFDLETAKKTLSVMDAQAAIARNAEAYAKKKKKQDDDSNKITEEELKVRVEILNAVGETVAMLESAGFLSKEFASDMQSMISFAGGIIEGAASGNYIGAILSGVSMFIDQIARFFDQTNAYEDRIREMNALLDRQRRLIELSQRKGGEKDALAQDIDLRKKDLELLKEQLAQEEKDLDSHWKNRFGKLDERLARMEDIRNQINEAGIALEDAEQAYTDFLAGGITETTLADTIIDGLRQGRIGVADFAAYMNDMLTEAVLQSFSAAILGPAITELQEMVAEALIDGILTEEEAKRINQRASEIARENEEKFKLATQGLNTETADTSLTGAIKGITEETASVLAGQMNAIRISQATANNVLLDSLRNLVLIESNTRYCRHLESIDSKLDVLKNNDLRALGLNG
jgi:hypothetical protein